MEFVQILALDLGKFKTVCCVMDVAMRTSCVWETIDMSPANVHDPGHARHVGLSTRLPRLVVFRGTCDTAGWVHDLCTALGTSITVVNANDERWRWRRVKRKTDRDDALKLARLALLDQLGAVHMPDPAGKRTTSTADSLHRAVLGCFAPHAVAQRDPVDLQSAGPVAGARRQTVDDRRR